MDIIDKALEFEKTRLSSLSTSDRVKISREAKSLILGLNEIYKQNYLAQSELELNKAHRQMNDARDAVDISKLAVEQSKESYRIVSNRFSQGLEKTSDLLYAETQLQKQELNYSQALFNYNYALSYLNFLTYKTASVLSFQSSM